MSGNVIYNSTMVSLTLIILISEMFEKFTKKPFHKEQNFVKEFKEFAIMFWRILFLKMFKVKHIFDTKVLKHAMVLPWHDTLGVKNHLQRELTLSSAASLLL